MKYESQILLECSAYEIVMFVHELHNRGYEQMRLCAGMSPSGMYWRWYIYPKVFLQKYEKYGNFEHRTDGIPFDCVYGSTGKDYPRDREMVNFEEVIAEIRPYVDLAKGEDKEYVEWFRTVVEHAEDKDFPIAFAEYFDGDAWKFMSGEKLPYPPYKSKPINELSDEQIIDYARCTFDGFSVSEMEEVISFEGIKPDISQIANVIRQAINEEKGLINHVELGISKTLAYLHSDKESEEEIEHGVRLKLKTGEVIDLIDEIDLFAYNRDE